MVEYMESELYGIFRVKLVTKNIVRESPGTHFMHMRVKMSLFWYHILVPVFLAKILRKCYVKNHWFLDFQSSLESVACSHLLNLIWM